MAAQETLARLRRRLAVLEAGRPGAAAGPVALGVAEVDGALGGGLARGRLHEVVGEGADAAPAAGFAALLALRAAGRRTLVWVRQEGLSAETGRLYGPGLAELGIDPARLVVVSARDAAAGLRSGLEAVRCAALGAVLIELWGEPKVLDLTATRRLSLAAEASGVTALLVRIAARPGPSAAATRWAVRSVASAPLPAGAPGGPAFAVTLLRHRGSAAGRGWHVEWNRDDACFRALAPLSRAVAALPAGRPAGPRAGPDGGGEAGRGLDGRGLDGRGLGSHGDGGRGAGGRRAG